ncbi:MAG: helix-turn-helix domain-containing protein [Butyricicoccus sp.]
MAAETRRVIWQHPRGIYAVIEVSGTGVFGVPYSYRETVYTQDRDARGVAHKELAAAVQQPVKLPKRLAVTDEEEQEICELYAKQMSIALVASSMHRSPQTVRAVLAKNDVEIRKGGPRITPKMIKQYTE